MFRKPMRLEKWIAFDGAVVADVAEAVDAVEPVDDADETLDRHFDDDADDAGDDVHGDGDNAPDDVQPLSFGAMAAGDVDLREDLDNGDWIKITYPEESTNTDLPFLGSLYEGSSNNIPAADVFFEITAPDDGKFSLWEVNDLQGFIDECNPTAYKWYAFDAGDGKFVVKYYNGTQFQDSGGGVSSGGGGEWAYSENGAIRFHVTEKGGFGRGEGTVNGVFNGIVYTPNDPAATTVGGYQINTFYKKDSGQESDVFHGGEGGMYNKDTEDVTVMADDDDKVYDDQGQWNNEPEPPTPPIVDPGIDEPMPPVNPPGGEGDGDGDGGDSGDSGDAGDSGDSGDSGDGEGEAGADAGGDDLVYIFHREEGSGDDGYSEEAGDDGEAALVEVEAADAEYGSVDSAASALAAELVREVEDLLTTVRGDREVLLQSLSALQMEYLRRGLGHDGPVRDFLRELFEMGNREKLAVNRIIEAMRCQMASFSALSSELRDGMLLESLRELVESAERRSGEVGALSQALEVVVKLLGERSDSGTEVDETAVRGEFDRIYAEAMGAWREKAERLDPMGRDLTSAERSLAQP